MIHHNLTLIFDMNKLSIDDRMKDFYEKRNRNYLIRRMPVIIRCDGKNFSGYSKSLKKPFDQGLIEDMQQTMLYLCKNIQGCKFGYTQSDEITLLLTDYDTQSTDAWFDYCQNKMESIAASMATGIFNYLRITRGIAPTEDGNWIHDFIDDFTIANFDARAFNIPREDVINNIIWRQNDCTKNSISMLAQSLYSHTELQNKNSNEMQEMCFQKGYNWNDLRVCERRGSCAYKVPTKKDLTGKLPLKQLLGQKNADIWENDGNYGIYTDMWMVDLDMPIINNDWMTLKQFC